jgi:hypothetical protein
MENIETQEASLSEIQTEFVESVDDYSNEKLVSSFNWVVFDTQSI